MKLINVVTEASEEALVEMLSDNQRVNEGVRFDSERGIPRMKVKKTGKSLRITCEMTGRATRDNGFIIGTFFYGRVKESAEGTKLRGVIVTDPLFHAFIFALFCVFIAQCIIMRGFSVLPIFVVLFDLLLFKEEFKKQGYIQRYIHRAVKRLKK